jgi:hypothetical protein
MMIDGIKDPPEPLKHTDSNDDFTKAPDRWNGDSFTKSKSAARTTPSLRK